MLILSVDILSFLVSLVRSLSFATRYPLPSFHCSIVPSLPLFLCTRIIFTRRERRRHQGTAVAASAASYGGSGGGRDHSDGCDHDDGHDVLRSVVAQFTARGDGGTKVPVCRPSLHFLPTVAVPPFPLLFYHTTRGEKWCFM